MNFSNIFTIVFVSAGIFFLLAGSIGVVRLPDFFSRSHATAKTDTLGIMTVLTGLLIYEGFTPVSLRLFLIIVFVAIANPVGSHVLARSALNFGIKPWFKKEEENN